MSPALPQIITPTLLSAIRKTPNLPQNTWYIIVATTLSVLNRPDEIPNVYSQAIAHAPGPQKEAAMPSKEDQLRISRRMREALVKSGPISGFPKVREVLA